MNRIEILRHRHSVRSYSKEVLEKHMVDELKATVTSINTYEAGLKFKLFFNNNDPFNGFFKSYGTFENPSNYLVAVVDEGVDHILEKAGYYAEKFVIKCIELGIGTCFVGGTYDPASINVILKAGEKILFVVLFGFSTDRLRLKEKMMAHFIHRKKYNLSHYFEPEKDFEEKCKSFPNLKTGTEAVECAPSAMNKRPVRVFIRNIKGKDLICAKVNETNKKNLIDLGIAKFNYNFVTGTECEWGNGSPLEIIL